MTAVLNQLPLAYMKKSSPGLTLVSIAARSTPQVPYSVSLGVGGGTVVVIAAQPAHARPASAKRLRFMKFSVDITATVAAGPLILAANRSDKGGLAQVTDA